ncbi:cation diffusion facilitator family transporter [Corynebacterium mendelii]|uniref:Cation transporter n=1 Tax=Corynebacterium mendelii TaxID=2765362 RepID=A0A939IY11_9CORY|nr:cation diffusion facilitator family transporter [Corynebacterium mendelii]MBN9644633.1 cation transporter [Corynebacterium mendelii]
MTNPLTGDNPEHTTPGGDHHHDHDHEHSHGDDHSHGHDHGGHDHSHAPKSLKALSAVIGLTTIIFLAEVIFGVLSGSLALLADAAHMLSDSAGLVMALAAMLIGRKAASAKATYGYRRVEVIAAAINAAAVMAISLWIVVEAIDRLNRHEQINTTMMLVVAVIGLAANTISALILVRRQHDSMNMQGAYLHVLADAFGSVAVIVAGLVVRYTGFVMADTIASVVIAVIILPRSLKLLRRALRVLMEQVPAHLDSDGIRDTLSAVDGVAAVHDLHLWSTDGNDLIATAHLVVTDEAMADGGCDVLDRANRVLAGMEVTHATLQIEPLLHAEHEPAVHD